MVWSPSYRTGNNGQFSVRGVSLTECPVTAITADSDDFREAYLRQRILADCGVAGLSPSQLPIRLAEAFIVIRQCENEISNAREAHAKLTQSHG